MKYFIPISIVCVIFTTISCAEISRNAGIGQADNSTIPASEKTQTLTIGAILKNSSDYLNKPINISAIFMGWNGKCEGPPPVTRSDWMIDDGTGCIYVSGKLPPGQDTLSPKKIDVTVKGIVKAGRTGAVYIQKM